MQQPLLLKAAVQVAHLWLMCHSRGRLPVHSGHLNLLLVLHFQMRQLLLRLRQLCMAWMARLLLLRSKQLPAVGSAMRACCHLPCQSQGIRCGSALLPLQYLLLLLLLLLQQCLPLRLSWLMLASRAGRWLSACACMCILLLLLLLLLLQTGQAHLAVCSAGDGRRPLRTAASRRKVHCTSW